MKGESMGKKLVIAAEVLVLVAVIIGTYFFFTKNETKSTDKEPSQTSETTARSSSQEVDPLDKLMDEMTLEEKVGQLFFVRVPEINQIEDIQAYHLGGYVLFSRDTDGETQDASDVPLLIGSDEEGGTVTRISQNPNLAAQPFASPQAIYASSGWEGIVEDTKQKADILTDLGINTGLFPIADVATDPNAFIYDRTIGLDADGTSEFVEKVVTTLKEAKSGSTLKHFPGYGNNRDSHVEIVTDERPLEEVEADYLPFEAGIKAGADSILVSHNIIASIDPDAPASISTKVHEVLRNQLNFDGVVMTDDMDMAGLANFISQEEAGLKALQAGNDLVMSSSYQQQIPYVIQAVQNGDYSEEQLNESVRRVLKWKQQLGLI
jgi:beta-N-acetylhexosaminidase